VGRGGRLRAGMRSQRRPPQKAAATQAKDKAGWSPSSGRPPTEPANLKIRHYEGATSAKATEGPARSWRTPERWVWLGHE
jgi:hypothetical protein